MTATFQTRTGARSIRRSKPPGEAELNSLLQLFPKPALLVDTVGEQIALVNSAFLQLTAFSSTEIVGHSVRTLFTGLPEHALMGDDLGGIVLSRRNRLPLSVNVKVRLIGSSSQWMYLIIEPQEELQKNLMDQIDQLVHLLLDLNAVNEEEPVRVFLERAAGKIKILLDVAIVAIYHNGDEGSEIWRVVESGEKGVLSDTIPANEYLRLSQTYVWRPGRRVQTDLHRTARINDLTYLASTPIARTGLLVVADRRHEPSDHLTFVLESFARQIGAAVANHLHFFDIRRLALQNRRDLSVWHSVAENSQEGILLLEPNFQVCNMNPAAEWMLGYAEYEVKDQPVENIIIGPDRLMPALESAYQGIPTHNMGNVSLHRRNGQSFPAHMEIIPAQREGETLAILIFFRDVSENIEFRNRTQQLEQRAVLGEVTAVFAHEVRNPINNISTGLQLLSVKLPQDDPNQENINRLLADCQRLNHLMESVLNFSRHSENKFEPVNLDLMLRRLMDRWRPRMAKVNVTPYIQVDERTPMVYGDPRSLEQVFMNLISNAVEAMSNSGGTLAVRVAPFTMGQGLPQVEVTVSDNGPGVPDDVKDRIFEPFVSTKSTGTGLGLAITKRIVTAHRGSISVNTFPGGTVFHVLLLAHQGDKG